MISGTIKMYSQQKNFGFLRPDDASLADAFFNITDCESDVSPVVGEKVEFELSTSAKGPRATAIRFVDWFNQRTTQKVTIAMTNQLEKIEPLAKRLEDAADKMDAAGIGGHAVRGHVAVLRDMASSMRADAVKGKMPDEYGGLLYAVADNNARLPKGRLSPLRTPAEVLRANPEHQGTISQLRGEGRRMGTSLPTTK
jgi:cold shock CspA family protein